jgi:hypothetical protein
MKSTDMANIRKQSDRSGIYIYIYIYGLAKEFPHKPSSAPRRAACIALVVKGLISGNFSIM